MTREDLQELRYKARMLKKEVNNIVQCFAIYFETEIQGIQLTQEQLGDLKTSANASYLLLDDKLDDFKEKALEIYQGETS